MTDSEIKTCVDILTEWYKYNVISHTRLASFNDAIDIEVERTYLSLQADVLVSLIGKMDDSVDISDNIADFSEHLNKFKGYLTMEVLRNGLGQ